MSAVLQMVREKWGGPAEYMKEICELTDEEVEKVRTRMITDDAPILGG